MAGILAQLLRPRLIAAIALLFYLGVSLDHLTVFPPVGEDEPWIAAAPYKLATQGVYGSDLFAGYYGVERHNYQQMPLYPLLQALVFKAFGAGVAQMRALPVVFGLFLLVLVYAVGERLGGERVGALAVVLMVTLRVAAVDGATGIVLLDRARVNRYDIAVPVFGFLALWLFASARYLWSGVLAGLASLAHLYGLFWLPALALAIVSRRGWRGLVERPVWLLASGVALTWVPLALFIASGWSDFLGQMRFVAARFDVFNGAFYTGNLFHGAGPVSLDWLRDTIPRVPWHRVGTWTVLAGIPAAVAAMLYGDAPAIDEKPGRHIHAVQAIPASTFAVVSIAQLAMFVVLLKVKTYSYMIALWPLAVLCLAWLGIRLWDRHSGLAVRGALAALGVVLVLQGGLAVARAHEEASHATPYDFFEGEIARCIPPGSRVLGLQHYWLGLRQFEYRTWLMPLNMANPLYADRPVPLDEALTSVHPDVILLDRYMNALLSEAAPPAHPNHRYVTGLHAFMEAHNARPLCVIRDGTYGTMEVYGVRR